MTAVGRERAFFKMLIDSHLNEEALRGIAIHLQHERDRLDNVIRPLTEFDQAKYDKETKILKMEEDFLYNLVDYLQVTGYIKTNIRNCSSINHLGYSEVAQGIPIKILRNSSINRSRILDEVNEIITLKINCDDGSIKYSDGLIYLMKYQKLYIKLKTNDPQSANINISRYIRYYYKDQLSIKIDIKINSTMFTKESSSTYCIQHQLDIYNKNQLFF